MAKRFAQFFFLLAFVFASVSGLLAQVRTVGQIVGHVEDPTGAVVLGAKLSALQDDTGLVREVTSATDGHFVLIDLPNGTYSLTVTAPGFKKAVYPKIKVDVGGTTNVVVKLEVGGMELMTVVVEGSSQILQTTNPTVESTVSGRTLRSLPLNNRDVLDFVLLMPGAQQAGTARTGTFNGLPKGALNITMDGLNVQDNLLKSSSGGGMFTLIRPKLDAVEEISVTSAVGGADAAGEGAIQIRFVTRRGSNDYHGLGFWYHRHESFNANTYLNRVAVPGRARPKNRLQQYGFTLGGPIIKDKVFFFFSYEDFRLPGTQPRVNRVLTTQAQQGLFPYKTAAAFTTTAGSPLQAWLNCGTGMGPGFVGTVPAGTTCTGNLFTLAQANALPFTVDSVVQSMFNIINPIVAGGRSSVDLFRDRFQYDIPASQRRWFPTMRLDWNITEKLRWNGIANFNRFLSSPDTLNRMDASFPGTGGEGGQFSDRYSLTTALNWQIKPNINYELRVGRAASVVRFFPETLPSATGSALFPRGNRMVWPLGLTSLESRPSATEAVGNNTTRSLPSLRTTPVLQFGNNVGWLKGKHTLNFGTNLTVITAWDSSFGAAGIPTVSASSILTTDATANPVFSATNLSGISASPDLLNARALYAMLTQRITSVSGSRNVNEITKTFSSFTSLTVRDRQNEFGVYATDSWRAFPDLTVSAGLRWEYQGAPHNRNSIYTSPAFADLWGKSGVGNLFKPGTLTGVQNPQINQRSKNLYNSYFNAWAPSAGLAWQPKFKNRVWNFIFGEPGKTAFRAGYSIAFTREGLSHHQTIAGGNPGLFQSNTAVGGTDFVAGSALLSTGLPTLLNNPGTFSFPTPESNFTFSSGMNSFDPNLKPAYVQSWQFGLQREIGSNMAIEIRYVGNHGTRLWRTFNINEVNIFENGFLAEFIKAKQNLDICSANQVACRTAAGSTSTTFASFANLGLAGQVALPIFNSAFSAAPGTPTGTFSTAVASSLGFSSAQFITWLKEGQAGAFANNMAGSATYLCRMAGNQLAACSARNVVSGVPVPLGTGVRPSNFFQVNPDLAGQGAFLLANSGNSTYNGLQIEFRRRMSKGLMVNVNYTFSKSLTDKYDDSAISNSSYSTLRNPQFDKGLSPFDLTHVVRAYWIYEFPFGLGRKWNSGNAVVNKIIAGWEFLGVVAWQSGRPFVLTSGRATVNGNDSFVIPKVNRKFLQNMVNINTASCAGCVFFFDRQMIDAVTGESNKTILDVPTTPGAFGQLVFLKGPSFFKPDFTIAKKTRITERFGTEFRAEFYNATNRTNWFVGAVGGAATTQSIQSTTFGKTTSFFNDLGNQDQGPRMVQFVLRVTF